jgi:hypothetical protein
MRFILSSILLAATAVSALSPADIVTWGAGIVSNQVNKGGEMRTMDSWSYVDCGEYKIQEIHGIGLDWRCPGGRLVAYAVMISISSLTVLITAHVGSATDVV